MLIDIGGLFKNEIGKETFDETLDLSDLEIFGEYPFKEPVRATGSVVNSAGILELNAVISYRTERACARCLKPVVTEKTLPIALHLVRFLQDEELESEGYVVVEGSRFDLGDEIRAALLLDSELAVLCSEDCRGICPGCGADLNVADCVCAPTVDPRLAKLSELAEKMKLQQDKESLLPPSAGGER